VTLPLAVRLAARELRGGLKGFRIFVACLAIGVAAIAAAEGLAQSVRDGLKGEARALLGGDVAIALSHRPASLEQRDWFSHQGKISEAIELRAMAKSADGRRSLVELKGVDAAYPLFGRLDLEPALADPYGFRDGAWGAAIDANLLSRLGLELGGRVLVGDIAFELRAVIKKEPDRVASPFVLGPRLLASIDAVEASGLLLPGSLSRRVYRLALAAGVEPQSWTKQAEARFPDAGWRLTTTDEAAPGFQRFLANMTLFLTLVGLTSLLVGGIGVANAVKSHIDSRIRSIAMLKALGASGGLIFAVYLLQILALAALGIAIGLIAGLALMPLGKLALAGSLPVEARLGLHHWPLVKAAIFGLLVALAFGLWPLVRARSIPPAALFRDLVETARFWPSLPYALLLAAILITLGAFTIGTASDRSLASWFVGVAALSFLLFHLVAKGLARLARHASARLRGKPGHPSLRLALANLHRPGATARSVILSLGLGLAVLVTLAQIEGNLRQRIESRLPEEAPAFFFIDLQPDQAREFPDLAARAGGREIKLASMVRGRVTHLDGQPADPAQVAPNARWALYGDRGFSTAREPPEDSRVIAGAWWALDHAGEPLVSIDANLAKGLGVKLGSMIGINVLGREFSARVASLREIDWTSATMNFAFVFSPGLLEGAPHTFLATVKADRADEDAIERAVTDRFANVSAIRIRQALESVKDVLEGAGTALAITAAVTLAAGGLVLAGAVAAGQRRRSYEAVLLKVLGASRQSLLAAHLAEFGLTGIATGLVAGLVGTVSAYGILEGLMRSEWTFLPWTTALTVLGSILATLLAGFMATARVLSAKAAAHLRTE
jgi:putative ABC transport system permease protein